MYFSGKDLGRRKEKKKRKVEYGQVSLSLVLQLQNKYD